MPPSRAAGRSFRVDIQGLRAVAVALVLLYHAAAPGSAGGFVGVDVFFVISGFLITSHLLREHEKHGRIRFVSFYARRAQRLLPAAVVVALATAIAAGLLIPRTLVPEELLAGAAALLGLPNMYFAYRGSDYLGGQTESVFQQYWSLGVEEQFYLVWPALLVLILWMSRGRRSVLVATTAVLVLASFALCMALMAWSQPWAFYALPSRAWELGVGALVAALGMRVSFGPRVASVMSWSGIALLVAALVAIDSSVAFPGPAAAMPVIASALLIAAGSTGVGAVQQLLGARPLRWLGDVSYSVYLVHWPIMIVPALAAGAPLPGWVRGVLLVASIAVGAILHRFVEEPMRRSPRIAARPRRALAGAMVVAVLAVSSVMIARPLVERSTVASDTVVAEAAQISSPPIETLVVPSNAEPPLMSALDDVAEVYDGPCHISELETEFVPCAFGDLDADDTVVLFGDSHAANWFPAFEQLAGDQGFRLEHYSKSRCSSILVAETFQDRPYWECDAWRDDVIEHLETMAPDLVVLANYAPMDVEGASPDQPTQAEWAAGVERIADRLEGVGEVVVLEDTPRHPEGPLECLALQVDDADSCSTPIADATDPALAEVEEEAADLSGIQHVSMNDYLCDQDDCPAVIDQYIVYRDAHHLTETASIALTSAVEDRIIRPLLQGE